MKDDLVSLVVNTLRETIGQKNNIPEFVGAGTSLFGQEGLLDSVGLVTLVVAVEQAIEDAFGVSITLADEKAMSQRHSPYRTVGSLAEFAYRVIQEEV
jgi:D-alanine--poly(phosphoribitol) ligase subunit 2